MATLKQALERVRESGALPPSGAVNIVSLQRQFHPVPARSFKALLRAMFGSVSQKLPWAVILCRFKGEAPNSNLESPIERLYRDMFAQGTGGLVEYWRDVSLGAIDISGSEVFGWLEIDIPRAQAGKGSGATRTTFVDSAIRAVQSDPRYAAKGFHSQIAVLCHNWSKDGAPPGADWRNKEWSEFWIDGSADGDGKVTLTPPHNGSITAHEMGHGFAMEHDVSADFSTHYADPCCIMSQRNSFTHPAWQVNFGPAVCLPHLVQRDWMYNRRVFRDNGAWLSQPGGITMTLAQTSDPGARAHLGVILSYTKAQTNWDYYLEYARPDGWNRGLTNDFLFIRRIGPGKDIGPTPAILGSIAVPLKIGTSAQFVEPTGNVRFQVERFDPEGRIVQVNVKSL